MSHLVFRVFLCRADNYGVLINDTATGKTVSIDAPDASVIMAELDKSGWSLTHILTTHHHSDHVEGNIALKKRFACTIMGPKSEADLIPAIDQQVGGGDLLSWAGHTIGVMDCPGHTKGHIAYHMPSEAVVFAGDTLFSLGCGRVFEGTMDEMYRSVSQFKKLPKETRLYCGHEYTLSNARFALSVEPGNVNLQERAAEVNERRARHQLTCPSTIGAELAANPFLRTDSPEIRTVLEMNGETDAKVFAELRRRKDVFK
ncbi:hydroxyacylglutathione hydrolase [Aestuariivirga sp.]|jgi:hydroxyacylglutathione hydrolase|uniref:hydroxyacylglutathione hydrolase n=1 Tax=Aestuariivirga sp. TaxID=2650926 RepID=UPI003783BE04